MEPFDVYGTAMESRDGDGEVFGLAELVFLVGDEAVLFLGQAEQLGDGVFEERFGDVLFVERKVVLEVVAEGFFVLLVAFTGEPFDESAIGQCFGGETCQFGDGFSVSGDGDEVSAASEEPHGDFESAQDARPASFDDEVLRMETAIVNKDR